MRRLLCLLPAGGLLIVGIVVPLATLIAVGLADRGGRFSLVPWSLALGDSYLADLVSFSLGFGVLVAVIAVSVGTVLALGIGALPRPWQRVAIIGVLVPKFANTLVILYGLQLLLSRRGPVARAINGVGFGSVDLVHNLIGAVVAEVYLVLPYAALLLIAARLQIPQTYLMAARGLGAGSARIAVRLILPMMAPAGIAAFGLCFIFGFGALTGPALLGGPEQFTLALDIQRQSFDNQNQPAAAVEAVIMLISLIPIGLLVLCARRVIRHCGLGA